MAGLHFDITADNTNIIQKLRETERGIRNTSKAVEQEGGSIEALFSRMTKAAAAFGAGFTAKELIQNIIQVRGEFQQLEVAFTTMLGSQDRATSLMNQLTETAAKTPFDLQGVANGARQLLAYGTAAEDVNSTLIRLGNIAAGLSIPLNDLVYLYGTTMTQGRLYTQDLNQFTGRGIPMIRELAKEFNVAESEIKSMVEAGKIGFPEVQKVIQNLTDEGGMFFNLMQEQSKTITGQISNIGDSFSMMLNNIGQANESIINDALGSVSYLIENYETVGKTLLEIVGTYGAYRAALITITALQRAYSAILAQSALNQRLAAASGVALSNAQALAATRAKLLQVAQSALNKTLLVNPYVAAAAAIAALGLGLYKLITYQTDAEKAQAKLNEAIKGAESASLAEERNLSRLKGELAGLKEGTEEYNNVKQKIIDGYSKYYDGLEKEINQVGLTQQAYENLTEAIRKSFAQRQYQQFVSEQDNELNTLMADNLGKIQDRLIDKLGEEAGSKYYAKIRDAIMEGNLRAEYIMNDRINIKGLDDETAKALDEVSGYGEDLFYSQKIERWIAEILKAYQTTEELSRRMRNRFGISDEANRQAEQNEEAFSTEGKSISQLEEEIGKAQSKLEELKKSLSDRSGTKEAVEQQEDYIKSLQDTVLEREKDLKVIGEVEARISKLKKEQKETVYGSKEYNSLQKRIDALDTKLPQTKSESNEEKKEKEARQKLADELLELQRKNQERETALMKEGTEKKLKQIDDDYEAQKVAIEKKQREWSSKNKELGVSGTNTNGLTSVQQTEIDRANALNASEREKQTEDIYKTEREAMYQYLKEYGTYQEKRLAITQEYQKKISEAGGSDTWQGKLLQKQMENELADVEENAGKASSAIGRLFGDMSEKTVDEIRSIADEAEQMLAYLEGGEFKTDASGRPLFGISEEWFNRLKESPKELASIKDEIQNVRNEADKAEPTFDKIKRLLDDIFNGNDDSKTPLEEKLQSLFIEINKLLQAARFLSNTFASLGNSFGSDTLLGVAEGLNAAIGSVESAMQGASAATALGLGSIGAAAGAAVGLVSSLAGAIAQIHDKKNEKRIQRLQDQIDVLDSSYEKLGRSIERAFSTDASELIEQQNKLLEQQKVLIQNQIKEEQDKKKTDNDRIKEWQQQIEEINQTLEDNKEKMVEAITGTDVMSAIDELAQAYADAWASGEDAAKASTDVVKNLIKTSLLEFLKKQLSPDVEEFMQKLADYMSDGVISSWEQAQLDRLKEKMDAVAQGYFDQTEDYWKDDNSTESQQQSASSGYEVSASQESVDQMYGRFTAMYEVGLRMYEVLSNMQSMVSSSMERNSILYELRNLSMSSNGHLEDIASFQKKIVNLLGEYFIKIDQSLKNL